MTAPGITVTTAVATPPPIPNVPTATWYVTGQAQRGPVGEPIKLQSMADYGAKLGDRSGYASLYDALDLFFRDGGLLAYVSRVAGPAAGRASLVLSDQATTPLPTLKVEASSEGAWGNDLKVAVIGGSVTGTYRLQISYKGANVETSPNLTTPDDAVNWSVLSAYVNIEDQGSTTAAPDNAPDTLTATSLTGGADDLANVVEDTWTAALDVFPPDLGPGQVSAPGRTTDAAHQALVTHAAGHNRIAVLDAPDVSDVSTLVTAAGAAITGGLDGSRGALVAPWVKIPGVPTANGLPAAPRIAPPSALAAARIAATDVSTGNPNTAAAGVVAGASSYAIGVTQTFTDAARGDLNEAGVIVIRNIASVVQVYGFRSLSPLSPDYKQLNWSRLRMAIQNEGQAIADNIAQFADIDAKGQLLGRLNGHLAGMLQRYWQIGALYGNSASEAFQVDTSSAVNTVETAAQGKVLAVLRIKRSAVSEFTEISIINVPLTDPL
jgi:hypothetical protein